MGYDTTAQQEQELENRDKEYGNEEQADVEGEAPLSGKFAKKVVNELYERYNTLVRLFFTDGQVQDPTLDSVGGFLQSTTCAKRRACL